MLIESVTDNKNRTVAELRHLIGKNNGSLGESGSVAWMFDRKGVVNVVKDGVVEDELIELILDAGADDLKTEGDFFEVVCQIENFEKARNNRP